ncbi:class I SAM-dependent methyltransferase [Nocardia sp. NBC_01327]|uniref:class I SAM-dependent methyltransferase n=1 Tax=Nocardia sp. NBC_01327 TaxID=2903593 RepID=UPI002E13BAD9|nr:class I SAM-dependent methyltransferase [Nocardia sp. NBC_01327]
MTTDFDPAPTWPNTAVARSDDDFDYIPWWTRAAITSVVDEIDTGTWCLMCDLVTDPAAVSGPRLRAGTAAITAVMESLWMRRALHHTPTSGRQQLPDRFMPLTTADPATWHRLGRIGAAWCLARLALFARHLPHRPGCRFPHHQIGDIGARSWQILTHDDGSYLYTAALAARYDRDRPFVDPEFTEAITAIAHTHLAGRDAIEFGAGTGTITRTIAPHARSVVAIEPAIGMRTQLHKHTIAFGHVQVRAADCMTVDQPDGSADAVYEHAALCFIDEPLFAVAEAARLLRPGGTLVRIIPATELPEQIVAFTTEFHTQLRRLGHGRGRIVTDGNNRRITDWLAGDEITTQVDTVATWTSQQPLRRHAAPLLNGSYPYLAAIPAQHRRRAIDAALTATRLDWDAPVLSTRSISTATSILGGACLLRPAGALR